MKTLLAFALAVLFIQSSFADTLYHSTVTGFDIIEEDDAIILSFHDVIQHPAAAEFRDSYPFLKKDKDVVVELNSGGGSIEEGMKIINFIERLQAEGFAVKTRVLNGRMCGSMCVPVFLSADNREAAETAAFMFHGVTVGWSTIPNKPKTLELFTYMKKRGLKQDFENYLWAKGALSQPGEYWITASDLMTLESGIITKTLSQHVKRPAISMPYTPKL